MTTRTRSVDVVSRTREEKLSLVTMSAAEHVTVKCVLEALSAFGRHVQQAERYAGMFSVADGGQVHDWSIPGTPGAIGETYVCTIGVGESATRADVLAALDTLSSKLQTHPVNGALSAAGPHDSNWRNDSQYENLPFAAKARGKLAAMVDYFRR
jgi:hypothetical protein